MAERRSEREEARDRGTPAPGRESSPNGRAGETPPPPDEVDEASIESFPASDPPSWTPLAAGPPDRSDDAPPAPPADEPPAHRSQEPQPPVEAGGRPYTVIYDGNCRTCVRLAEVLKRWDRGAQVWVVPSIDPRIPDLYPWIPQSAYERALQMVGPGRTTVEGAEAIEKLLDLLPGGTPLARLFSIPVMGRLLDRGYRWFARNRRSFGCGDHCTIPLESPETP